MAAYYNEIDTFAAAWLRELIKAKLIADGEVDERSIELVQPGDLRGFTQCHFFAGIGGWSYALRLAGWPDEREVWTGSCPCQPFSAAGKGAGAADSRHLWPAWFRLIRECRPHIVFGEQVASVDGLAWVDLVSSDLEGQDYAVAPVDLCGPCVGAFDIRQRLWFVADTASERYERERLQLQQRQPRQHQPEIVRGGEARRMADSEHAERRTVHVDRENGRDGPDTGRTQAHGEPRTRGEVRTLDDAAGARQQPERCGPEGEAWHEARMCGPQCGCETCKLGHAGSARLSERERDGRIQPGAMGAHAGQAVERGSHVSFWADAEWIPCTDGKWRPVEPGTFPLATGVSARVGRLRGYGNSIKPQVAQVFIEAYCDARGF